MIINNIFRPFWWGLLFATAAHGAYPEKPVRIIVPFPPGGSADILARTLGNKLHPVLRQVFIVDNRAGAAGNIGTDLVAKSKPDGYTLLVGLMNTHVVNQAFNANLPFKGIDDFTPVANLAVVITTMAIHPSVPAHNVKQFIAVAKANPGKLNIGIAGANGAVGTEILKAATGMQINNVPYKGSDRATTDLVGGQVQVGFHGFPNGRRSPCGGHIDHRHGRPRRRLRIRDGRIDRNALKGFSRLLRIHAGDKTIHPVRVGATLLRVELADLAGHALGDDLGIFIYQYRHGANL